MKLKLEIACDNDAFAGDPREEQARILEYAAKQIKDGWFKGIRTALLDLNGNKVGHFWVEE